MRETFAGAPVQRPLSYLPDCVTHRIYSKGGAFLLPDTDEPRGGHQAPGFCFSRARRGIGRRHRRVTVVAHPRPA